MYDLHCHSDQSDGILSPEQLVSRAKANNVAVLALTDHDTVKGVARAKAQAGAEGISLVAGIEFSSQWQGRGVHIVGLAIDLDSPVLFQAIAHQGQVREKRARQIAGRLERLGIPGALEGARRYASGDQLGRPHFARFLIDEGHAGNMNQAFKRYLGAGKPGDIKQDWPDFGTVVDWITEAGGVAVLAHPAKYKMTRSKLCAMVQHFADSGGRAIEIVCSKQSPDITANLVKIASKFGLHGSCGSDFHSPGQPWQELGGFGSLPAGVPPVWELWQ